MRTYWIFFLPKYFLLANFPINNLAVGLHDLVRKAPVLAGIPKYPEGNFFPGYGVDGKNPEEYSGKTGF